MSKPIIMDRHETKTDKVDWEGPGFYVGRKFVCDLETKNLIAKAYELAVFGNEK